MKLEIVKMPTWKSKILNGVARLLGIRDENCWIVTISNDFPHNVGDTENIQS